MDPARAVSDGQVDSHGAALRENSRVARGCSRAAAPPPRRTYTNPTMSLDLNERKLELLRYLKSISKK